MMRILHVEDNIVCREVVRVVLGRAGYTMSYAVDGPSGVQMIRAMPDCFDMVITDHEMPGMCGLEVVAMLHRIGFSGKIMVYSGALDTELMEAYGEAGVDGFLCKPTAASMLISAVEAINPLINRRGA
jgi:CheY-like chemotaxis protein